jgi:hypothetical protein
MMLVHHRFSWTIALCFSITILWLDSHEIYNCFILLLVDWLISWIDWVILILLVALVVISIFIIEIVGLCALVKGFGWLQSVMYFSNTSLVFSVCISYCHIELNMKIL